MSYGSRLTLICILVTTLLIVACGKEPPPTPANTAAAKPAQWDGFVNRYVEDSLAANPFLAVDSGRHEFDGKAPDWSAQGFANEIARLKAARAEAEAFPADALSPQQRFERDYLVAGVINRELFWMDTARLPFENPAYYIGKLDPDPYLSREYAPLEKRMAGFIGYARNIPQLAADIRANLRTPMPKSLLERGVGGFGGYAEFYRNDVPKVFAGVQDADLQKQLAEATDAAAAAMNGLKSWLESQRASATNDYALGEALFTQMLKQTEDVDVPLKDLLAAGQADLDRNLKALREACDRFLPKKPITACIDKMNASKPKEGTVRGAIAQLNELQSFVTEKKLVTIPSPQQAAVKESPPYNRANSAYINIPGPFEKGVVSTYFVAPPDPAWSAKERAEYIPGVADLLFTSAHEVWPGHYLQFQHSTRNKSIVAGMWVGYAYAEGWAHYAEEMMWEAGIGTGEPEYHVGQLTNALLRNVRYMCAIGLHTQGMTVEQCEKLFRESAFSDAGTARQQAARGTYDPAYLNYTLGKLMIRKLRTDWMAVNPLPAGVDPSSPRKWQAFHDKFLSYGGPPIPLVRREMMGPQDKGSLF
ncbi:MAG: DUF885 domain-containing protein [Gammaproteobacteria bacterium]